MKTPAPGGGDWSGVALLVAAFLVIAAPWILLPRPLNMIVSLGIAIVVAAVLLMALFPEVAEVMEDLNQDGGRR
ncbi:MAG: hypothetical protein MAG715_00350 [Methanonatronarchaeales archaeon]|nr:hypothetical protein [Methanonatronarchaeales archaeon]